MADNAHFLIQHGNTFMQTSKGCFPVERPSHLIVPRRCWQCLLLLKSTTEIANIAGFRNMADNAHFLVQDGNTFVQTSKVCFPVQNITHDRSTQLLAVPSSFFSR